MFGRVKIALRDLRILLDRGHMAFSLGLAGPKNQESPMPLEVTITNEQKIKLTATPVTAAGNPAALDGGLAVGVISGDGFSVPVEGDPLSVMLVSGSSPGDTVFLIEADADLGAGVVTVSDTVTLHVQGALAANLGLTLGTPEAK